jgi:hypothetical protein
MDTNGGGRSHPIPRGHGPAWPSGPGYTPYPAGRTRSKLPAMPIINVVLTLVVVGVLLWLINTYIPMQSTIKSIMNIVVVIAVVLWLLYGFGIISHNGDIKMPVVK